MTGDILLVDGCSACGRAPGAFERVCAPRIWARAGDKTFRSKWPASARSACCACASVLQDFSQEKVAFDPQRVESMAPNMSRISLLMLHTHPHENIAVLRIKALHDVHGTPCGRNTTTRLASPRDGQARPTRTGRGASLTFVPKSLHAVRKSLPPILRLEYACVLTCVQLPGDSAAAGVGRRPRSQDFFPVLMWVERAISGK